MTDGFTCSEAVHQPGTVVAVLDGVDAEEDVVSTSASVTTADVSSALIPVVAWDGPTLPTVCTPSSPLTFP